MDTAFVKEWRVENFGLGQFSAEVKIKLCRFIIRGISITNTSKESALTEAVRNAIGIFSCSCNSVCFANSRAAAVSDQEGLLAICRQAILKSGGKRMESTDEAQQTKKEEFLFVKFMACCDNKEAIKRKLPRIKSHNKKSALLYNLKILEEKAIPRIVRLLPPDR